MNLGEYRPGLSTTGTSTGAPGSAQTEAVVSPKVRPGRAGSNGNGSRGGGGGNGGDDFFEDEDFPRPNYSAGYRIGMWVALAAILMLFAAITSAYIIRSSSAPGWSPLALPGALWISTVLIMSSSYTFENAKRALRSLRYAAYGRWLTITLVLGCGFLVSQLLAWRQLISKGVYLKSNPHSSFFYLLTGLHGIHLLGGMLALLFLVGQKPAALLSPEDELKQIARTGAIALYWHFMAGLWVYLFLLLYVWT